MTVATKPKLDLDHLRNREAELAEQVEATRGRLSQYSSLIAEARREAVYAGKARPGGELGGSVRTLTDKEKKDATALIGLEGDLSATRSVIAEEVARLAEGELLEIREQDKRERDRQAELLRQAGAKFAELVGIFNELVEAVEEHDRSRTAAKHALPANLAAYLDAEGQALLLSPMPVTFAAFLRMLSDAMLDPNRRGYREGPRAGGIRLDDREALVELTPDLRETVRRPELGGQINRAEE